MSLALLLAAAVVLYMMTRPTLVQPRYAPGHYLAPAAAAAFDAACEAAGETPRVTSSYRSAEQQAELVRRYEAGEPGIFRPAPPGRSLHERGLAIDARGSPSWEDAMRAQGWRRPLPVSDPVHWEYAA